MRRLTLLAFFALIGCDDPARPGADGHRFHGAEFVRLAPVVEIIIHPSLLDLRRAAKAAGVSETADTAAFSVISPTNPAVPCRVHIVDPAVRYQPQWLGHEITHCIYGRWHA